MTSIQDAQLLAVLLPRLARIRATYEAQLTGRARGSSTNPLTSEALWQHTGKLLALADLEQELRSDIARMQKDLEI